MPFGTLFLIPTLLGDTPKNDVLPPILDTIIPRLRYFIVENEKSARYFLKQFDLETPLQALQLLRLSEHTTPEELPKLLTPLREGHDCGLLSEAGCPCVADPGADLVRLAHALSIRVRPLVGPNSILLALMGSGLCGQRFSFVGYLERDRELRVKQIRELENRSRVDRSTQLFIETPYRTIALFQDLLVTLDKETFLSVAQNLTCENESIITRSVAEWTTMGTTPAASPTIFLLEREPSANLTARNHRK